VSEFFVPTIGKLLEKSAPPNSVVPAGGFGLTLNEKGQIPSAAVMAPFTGTAGTLQVSSAGVLSWSGAEYTPWKSYTPVWTSSGTAPSIGNSVAQGQYTKIGNLVVYQGQIVFGNTATFGTGNYRISFPVTPSVTWTNGRIGSYDGYDGSTGNGNQGICYFNGAADTYFQMFHHATFPTGTLSFVGQLVPWTWASTDELNWTVVYRAA
jgi:hypothetical protein